MSETPSPAPFLPRTAAFLLDQVVVLVSVVGPLAVAGVDVLAPVNRWPIFLALMAVAFLYHFLLEGQTGTTLGKRLFGLRVVADDGRPLGLRGLVRAQCPPTDRRFGLLDSRDSDRLLPR